MIPYRWFLGMLIMLFSFAGPSGMAFAFLDELSNGGLDRQIKGKGGFNFVGYWEAIDPEDGAVGNLSIIYMSHGRNDGNGANLQNADNGYFQILSASSALSPFCGGQPGYTKAKGLKEKGILVATDRRFFCRDEGDSVSDDNNLSPVAFIPMKEDDVLMMEFLTTDRDPIFFHRISSSPRSRGLFGLR